ncbi:MAG: mononuclear molybdenum enzyme YedY [Gammaproteobacteria bacterium RIFCSPLOWO2_02_FULL_47_50]|nr:MAG: mononuclear molybdenum enzyme YedY [Gammaproteobacteria bacterium RIFCSPLOWO2_02_FULL_47_50]
MLTRKPSDIKPSEITPESIYRQRRKFMQDVISTGVAGALVASFPGLILAKDKDSTAKLAGENLSAVGKSPYSTDEPLTPFDDVTTYNNFYEFGTDKGDPVRYSGQFKSRPWSIAIEGECARPGVYDLEDFIAPHQLEDRIYRLRCVEAWSMVIPWVGIPLGDMLKRFEPTSRARYVAFTTVYRPDEMPGQKRSVLQWPYVEGLRMDEAMNPLSILSVGLYGKVLPNQNGAPIRLIVPWKYGYKSIKSIVKIVFTEKEPPTTWNISAPGEYGFYSNVNPEVNHPRWSQRKERRIGDFFKRETLMFNGYADQVAGLYAGMDLHKHF